MFLPLYMTLSGLFFIAALAWACEKDLDRKGHGLRWVTEAMLRHWLEIVVRIIIVFIPAIAALKFAATGFWSIAVAAAALAAVGLLVHRFGDAAAKGVVLKRCFNIVATYAVTLAAVYSTMG